MKKRARAPRPTVKQWLRQLRSAKGRKTLQPLALCLGCGKPVALHFDARGRKLDCARVPDKLAALADARARVAQLTRYIAKLERIK